MAEIIAEAPDRKLCFLVPAILVSCSLNSLFRRGLSVEISLDREGYPLGFGQIIAASGIIAENRTFSASTGRVLVPGCGGVSAIPLGLSDADSFSTQGYDVAAFAEAGNQVIGLDISEGAAAVARKVWKPLALS